MFSKNRNKFKNFISNINKLTPTPQPQEQNTNHSLTMKKQLDYNDKGDRVNSRDDGGYTCNVDKDRGTCTNNRTGESVNVSRNNDNSWSIDTSNTGSKNTFGSNYPSNIKDNDKDYGGYSGGSSYGGSKNTGYSPQELHVINTVKALGNSVLGASTHDSRKEKTKEGYNATLKFVVESIKYSGYTGQKGLLFSDSDLTAHDMNYLSATMPSNNYNFKLVDFSNNSQIGALGVDYLIKGAEGISHLQIAQTALDNHNQNKPMMLMGKPFELPPEMLKSMTEQVKTINPDDYTYKGLLTRGNFNAVIIDISNCNIGDIGADIISDALCKGRMPNAKYINISGNNITKTGDTKIIQALKGVWQDIAVFTHKLDEIVKMGEGTKEEKIAIYKAIVEKGKSLGTYDKAMVVDKSWFGKVEHGAKHVAFKFKWLFGFSKCHLLPDPKEEVTSYAQDKIIATLPSKTATGLSITKKGVGVLTKHYDFVMCFISTTDAIWSSELGQEIAKHELCLLGEQDFCHGEQ